MLQQYWSCIVYWRVVLEWRKCGCGLGIYDLLEDSMVVTKLEPGVDYLDGVRWFLEWNKLSSRFDKPKGYLSSHKLMCGE